MKKIFVFIAILLSAHSYSQTIVVGQQYAQTPKGTTSAVRTDGDIATTSTPLAANGSYTTGWIDVNGYKEIYFSLISDQAGSLNVAFSGDTTTILSQNTRSYTNVGFFFRNPYPVNTRYVRYTYTNGSTAQTVFWLRVYLANTLIGSSNFDLNQRLSGREVANTDRVVIEMPDATNGTYDQVTRTNNSMNVHVDNMGTTDSNTTRKNVNATVLNFPATQPVSGTVSVSNFPASETVSVSNFPATQPVSGTVTANIDSTKTRLQQNVVVQNFPAGNLEATQQSVLTGINAINTDQGAPADAAATSSTGTYGEIALLKGIYALLNGGGSLVTSATPYTPYYFNYQTTSGVQTLKATAGTIGSIEIENPGSSDLFIQIFATTGTVTLGTTTPTWVGHIDAALGKIFFNNAAGIYFTNGIKYAITTSYNGSGAPGAAMGVSIGYK